MWSLRAHSARPSEASRGVGPVGLCPTGEGTESLVRRDFRPRIFAYATAFGRKPRADSSAHRVPRVWRRARTEAGWAVPRVRHAGDAARPGRPRSRGADRARGRDRRDRLGGCRVGADVGARVDRGCAGVRRRRSRHVLSREEDLLTMEAARPSLRVQSGRANAVRADLLVVPVAGTGLREALRRAGVAGAGVLRRAQATEFRGRPEDAFLHAGDRGVMLFVGSDGAPSLDAWRKLGARARREAERQGAKRVAAYL